MFSSGALWQCGGQTGREPHAWHTDRIATGSPRPVVVRIRRPFGQPGSRQVSWLTAACGRQSRPCRHAFIAPSRRSSGCAMNLTVYSCGGSCGVYRIPVLAPCVTLYAWRTSNRQGYAVTADRSIVQIDDSPPPMLSCTPCFGCPSRGETGNRCAHAVEQVRCCPRNGKREKVLSTVPRHGKVTLQALNARRLSPSRARRPARHR